MLLAKKKNMTRIFDDAGVSMPITVLDFSECRLIKGLGNSGSFVGIGFVKKPRKSDVGKYGSGNVPEYAVSVDSAVEALDIPNPGDLVSVCGKSKGKGFAGVVRMWGFKGGDRSHGQKDRERHPGSIGAGTTTGRVFPGLRMAKRKGNEMVTVRCLRVVSVDLENGLMVVAGTVPGRYNSILEVYKNEGKFVKR